MCTLSLLSEVMFSSVKNCLKDFVVFSIECMLIWYTTRIFDMTNKERKRKRKMFTTIEMIYVFNLYHPTTMLKYSQLLLKRIRRDTHINMGTKMGRSRKRRKKRNFYSENLHSGRIFNKISNAILKPYTVFSLIEIHVWHGIILHTIYHT